MRARDRRSQDTTLVAITRNQINEHLNHGDSVVNLLQVILKRYRNHLNATTMAST